jgi:CopG family nickel-responsive transcriptional regulator
LSYWHFLHSAAGAGKLAHRKPLNTKRRRAAIRERPMRRVTITIEDDLLAAIDALMQRRHYASRSEAVRDMVRAAADRDAGAAPETPCIAVLSYVYDHATRDLAQRLIQSHHQQHDLSLTSLHVHLDHDSCLEVSVLRGRSGAVHDFADQLTSQRGVRRAALHLIPAELVSAPHDHGSGATPHTHVRA